MLMLLTYGALVLPLAAKAASCKTQSQLTAAERDVLSNAARGIVGEVLRLATNLGPSSEVNSGPLVEA